MTYSTQALMPFRLDPLQHHTDVDEHSSPASLSQQWMNFTGRTTALGWIKFAAGEDDSAAVSLDRRLKAGPDWTLDLNYGALVETTTLLGSELTGAFGEPQSASMMTGLSYQRDVRNWQLSASAMASLTSTELSDGLTQTAGPLLASSFAHSAQRKTDHGSNRLTVSQLLRIEDEETQMRYPSGINTAEEIHYDTVEAALAPSGRQLDLEASYQHRIAKNMSLGHGLWVTEDLDYIQGTSAQRGLVAALQARF